MAIRMIYCGEADPTDECETSGWCDYHAGRPVDWDTVDHARDAPLGGFHPIRTTAYA